MLSINNQNPSTLALRLVDDDDFRLSCRSIPSKERIEEQVRGGRDIGSGGGGALVGEMDGLVIDGDGEKQALGTGVMMPFRLGDLDIFFPEIVPGSCNGNRHEYFMSCTVFRCSTTVLMVGLSEGSF